MNRQEKGARTQNKPLAFMAADVNTQALVLRKTISDYPRCFEVETATNAIAKTSCRQTENTNFCDYENYMNTDNSKYYSLTLTLLGVFLVYFCYEVDLPEFLYFKWLRSIILFLSLPSFLLSLFYIRQSIKKEKSIDRYIILIITSICLFCSLVLHMWFLTLFILWGGNESSLASL